MKNDERLSGFFAGLNSQKMPLVRVAKGTHCLSGKVIVWRCLSPDPSLQKYDSVTFHVEGNGSKWIARDVEAVSA